MGMDVTITVLTANERRTKRRPDLPKFDLGRAWTDLESARRLAGEWRELFPGRYYIELQRPGKSATVAGAAAIPVEVYVQRAARLASELKLPVVATHPVQFVSPDDYRAHEARVCIAEGYVLSDMEDIKDLEEHVENSKGFLEFYPKLACDLAHLRFSADGVPKREHLKTALGMIKKRGFLRIAKDLFPLRKVAI